MVHRFMVYLFINDEQTTWLLTSRNLEAEEKFFTCGNFPSPVKCSTCPNQRSGQGAIYFFFRKGLNQANAQYLSIIAAPELDTGNNT